eukprot:4320263-Amphidinium_carterae.1
MSSKSNSSDLPIPLSCRWALLNTTSSIVSTELALQLRDPAAATKPLQTCKGTNTPLSNHWKFTNP